MIDIVGLLWLNVYRVGINYFPTLYLAKTYNSIPFLDVISSYGVFDDHFNILCQLSLIMSCLKRFQPLSIASYVSEIFIFKIVDYFSSM